MIEPFGFPIDTEPANAARRLPSRVTTILYEPPAQARGCVGDLRILDLGEDICHIMQTQAPSSVRFVL